MITRPTKNTRESYSIGLESRHLRRPGFDRRILGNACERSEASECVAQEGSGFGGLQLQLQFVRLFSM